MALNFHEGALISASAYANSALTDTKEKAGLTVCARHRTVYHLLQPSPVAHCIPPRCWVCVYVYIYIHAHSDKACAQL